MINEFLDGEYAELRGALNFVGNGEAKRGLEAIETYLQKAPNVAAAHRAKGMALAALSQFSQAVESIRVAIGLLEKSDPAYYVDLGEWLLEANRPDEAYAALSSAIDSLSGKAKDFYFGTATIARAIAAYQSHRPDLALADLRLIGDDVRYYCLGGVWSKEKLRDVLKGKK